MKTDKKVYLVKPKGKLDYLNLDEIKNKVELTPEEIKPIFIVKNNNEQVIESRKGQLYIFAEKRKAEAKLKEMLADKYKEFVKIKEGYLILKKLKEVTEK